VPEAARAQLEPAFALKSRFTADHHPWYPFHGFGVGRGQVPEFGSAVAPGRYWETPSQHLPQRISPPLRPSGADRQVMEWVRAAVPSWTAGSLPLHQRFRTRVRTREWWTTALVGAWAPGVYGEWRARRARRAAGPAAPAGDQPAQPGHALAKGNQSAQVAAPKEHAGSENHP